MPRSIILSQMYYSGQRSSLHEPLLSGSGSMPTRARQQKLLITPSLVPAHKHVHLQAGKHTHEWQKTSATALIMSSAGLQDSMH